MKLTEKEVQKIDPGERRFEWDDDLPGFGLRVTEGAVAYVVDFKVNRRRRRVSLGSTKKIKYEAAKNRAKAIMAAAVDGRDITKGELPDQPTFEQVWREMIDIVDRPRLSPVTIKDYEDRAARQIIPKIGHKRIGDVTPADVDKILAAAPGARNKTYLAALIKKTVNYAIRDHRLPASHHNPAADISVKRGPRRARAIEEDDLTAFGRALVEMESEGKVSPWAANLFRLSLICGLRPGEVRSLTWERVNIPRRKATVIGKTGEREIDLTDAAIQILTATPRTQGCEYVFAGRRYGQPLVAIHKILKSIQERAGIDRFRPYDLRHSAATGALAAGADVRAVQALMGHADLQTTAGYLHSTDKRRRDAAERAAQAGKAILK